jgi:hypothetical protein
VVRRWKLLIAVLVMVIGLGLLAGQTSAAPSSKGAGPTQAVLQLTPSTVVVGSTYQESGTGFRANTWVTVGAHYDGVVYWSSIKTDGYGRFTITATAEAAGSIFHEAKEQARNGSLRLKATATLTVLSS